MFWIDMILYFFGAVAIINIILNHQELSQMIAEENATEESACNSELNLVLANAEVHYDSVYLFDANSDEFLSQGKTFSDAVDVFASRFPRKTLLMDSSQVDALTTNKV